MPSAPPRGPITTRLITELQTEGFPVGDNAPPETPYGWEGQPNDETSTFTPWMSITPGTGLSQNPPGAFGDTGTEWRLNYNIYYAGLSRKQSEALADKMRLALTNIAREVISTPTGDWKIQKISCASVGSNNRVSSAYPDYFTQSDSFEVWVSKG